jgi:hypothetical protein
VTTRAGRRRRHRRNKARRRDRRKWEQRCIEHANGTRPLTSAEVDAAIARGWCGGF